MPTYRARRLRQDGLVTRAAASPHCAATAVEHTQPYFSRQCVKRFRQGGFRAVQLPVAGENATVFVAVGVTQHDVLLATTGRHHVQNATKRIKRLHDRRRIAQIRDGFEQGYDDQVILRALTQDAAHQAGFFLKQQNFKQIAHGFGMADDVVANAGRAKPRHDLPGGFENCQFALGQRAVSVPEYPQGARIIQKAQQNGAFFFFSECFVAFFDARYSEQLSDDFFMFVRVLA